jgi:hypothetical protein
MVIPLMVASTGRAFGQDAAVAWRDFMPELFAEAARQKRLVLLDLGTGWCHWCHVMEETTYRDAAVVKLLREHYLAARADADQRLDLANRYEEYGWPATIVFDAAGRELVKFRGYVAPGRMASLLKACVEDPTPGPSARPESEIEPAASSVLPADLRAELQAAHAASYDPVHAGFGAVLKYLPEWSVELDFELARRGDREAEMRARATLAANLKLVDPAWGGVYQYSHGGDWDHPHFEKIMSFQALDLRLYAQAFALFGEESHRKAAQDVRRYLSSFLRGPDGAFFASQDADLVPGEHAGEYFALGDAQRRRLGVPRIDRSVYARENGWAIESLALCFELTGDESALGEAQAAARAILATRRVEGGGFRHGAQDLEALYLGDSLAMGIALLELHQASGGRARAESPGAALDPAESSAAASGRAHEWLDAATAAADFIETRFGAGSAGAAGYPTAPPAPDATGAMPRPQRDENLSLARFAHRLHRFTGEERFARMRDRALRWLLAPPIARRFPAAGVLLVLHEIETEPLHVTVVARRGDPAGRALHERALRIPTRHKLVEWWSPEEDPPLPGGLSFPELHRAAAFLCTASGCSPPVFDVLSLERALDRAPAR